MRLFLLLANLLILPCLGVLALPGATVDKAAAAPAAPPHVGAFRVVVPAAARDEPCDTTNLTELITCSDRPGIRAWAAQRTLAQINQAVTSLPGPFKERLPEVLLSSNAGEPARSKLLGAMAAILQSPDLGFYVDIWSYTDLMIEGTGFVTTCGRVSLTEGSFLGLSDKDARNVVAHESLHSFICVNNGPYGALNEGAAIFVFKAAFPTEFDPRETWAEGVFGTKLYYRDLWQPSQPNYPVATAYTPTAKLTELFTWLSSKDASKIPWNSNDRLQSCYEKYFAPLDRDVDFFAAWLPAQWAASQLMLADPSCRPL